MKISIIIVNYNVEYFLDQCLHSVYRAIKNLEAEVWVVDNHSIDGSCDMVRKKFPQVKLIENKINAGFSRANNQAIQQASGEYILLLNPDTVLEEDTLEKTVLFMDEYPDAGGLGVKMIDGRGNFLPESKRGLPTPSVAFYKIFGLSSLFPRSKRFGKYHLGYLDQEKTHQVEILSGAFMLLRKKALNKTGLLDESFFMYGEDIDLSYRILKAGYNNYYYPGTRIIHYKGESTKKSSVNYVFVFYNAMIIFARKHFSEKNARTFSFLINLAIYLRAFIALLNRFIRRIILPVVDFSFALAGLFLIAGQYEQLKGTDFPEELLRISLPAYSLTWMFAVWISGGYDKPIRLIRIIKGLLIGTAIILMIYGLLPKEVQFSRVFLLLGTLWVLASFVVIRLLLHVLNLNNYSLTKPRNKRFVIVGLPDEVERVSGILRQTNNYADYIAFVHPEINKKDKGYVGNISQLYEIVDVLKIDEIIFCSRDNTAQQIIDQMSGAGNRHIDFKIAQPESLYLIGSNSIDTSGDLYVLDINSISRLNNRRNKRLFDIAASLLLLLFSPLLFLFNFSFVRILPEIFSVLLGKKTLVGYSLTDPQLYRLPAIKKGLIPTTANIPTQQLTEETQKKVDIIYAKDYRVTTDLGLLIRKIPSLGK